MDRERDYRSAQETYLLDSLDGRRITRLVMEAIEISFYLCNKYLDSYGMAKVFDVLNQIMPTAYVLNTSYWIFYSTPERQCLCICGRYAMKCPHTQNREHWVNLERPSVLEENDLFRPSLGHVHPVDFSANVSPVCKEAYKACDLLIRLGVKSVQNLEQLEDDSGDIDTFYIQSRFIVVPEYYPMLDSFIKFTPHPLSHPSYSNYFKRLANYSLLNRRDSNVNLPENFIIASADVAKFTIIVGDANFSIPFHLDSIHAIPLDYAHEERRLRKKKLPSSNSAKRNQRNKPNASAKKQPPEATATVDDSATNIITSRKLKKYLERINEEIAKSVILPKFIPVLQKEFKKFISLSTTIEEEAAETAPVQEIDGGGAEPAPAQPVVTGEAKYKAPPPVPKKRTILGDFKVRRAFETKTLISCLKKTDPRQPVDLAVLNRPSTSNDTPVSQLGDGDCGNQAQTHDRSSCSTLVAQRRYWITAECVFQRKPTDAEPSSDEFSGGEDN